MLWVYVEAREVGIADRHRRLLLIPEWERDSAQVLVHRPGWEKDGKVDPGF